MGQGFDNTEFRRALGQFPTGVTVITTVEPDGTPRGFTANSFTSVSLDPPLLLVCVANTAASRAVFCDAPRFSVNVLAEDQQEVSGLFASQRADKFERASWRSGTCGMPLIDGAIATFECHRHDLVEAGDHVILIGHVDSFDCAEGQPLGYVRGSYFALGLETSLVDATSRAASRGARTVIGAIYERGGSVLLEADTGTGALQLPAVGRKGTPASLSTLMERYAADGFTASVDFVYAVFEDKTSGTVSIYYRGRAEGPAPDGTRFIPFAGIDFSAIGDPACRSMLKRYVSEARQARFAVYTGDEAGGIVQPIE